MMLLTIYQEFNIILLSIILAILYGIKIFSFNLKVSIFVVLSVIVGSIFWKHNSGFRLESPSIQSKAYVLYYTFRDNKIKVSHFFPHSKKVFERYEKKESMVYLRLLNLKQCLVLEWEIDSPDISNLKDELGTYSMMSFPIHENICPEKTTRFKLTTHKFNHVFEKVSQTSSKHIYFF